MLCLLSSLLQLKHVGNDGELHEVVYTQKVGHELAPKTSKDAPLQVTIEARLSITPRERGIRALW